jgi:signal peptidase II
LRIRKQKFAALLIPTVVVVIVDQISKHWIRTTPSLHDFSVIKGILSFHYTQNPGMALGMRWADTPVISVIAIVATVFILLYIISSLPRANRFYLVCMGLILGGAIGNILDRLFMARIGNYGTYLEGHVVDFIHFTLRINDWPVFPYIFNVADMAISTSLILLLIFHNRILPDRQILEEEASEEEKNITSDP